MKELYNKKNKPNTLDELTRIFFLICVYSISVYSSVFVLNAQSLWVDRNPYANGQDIRLGSVIRVLIKDGIKGDYVYEGAKDDSFVIRSHPDKKL